MGLTFVTECSAEERTERIESLKDACKATVFSVRVAGTLSYYILYTYKFRDLGSVCVCVRERFRRLSEGDANFSYEINHYI